MVVTALDQQGFDMKTCSECKLLLAKSCFHKYRSVCKSCKSGHQPKDGLKWREKSTIAGQRIIDEWRKSIAL